MCGSLPLDPAMPPLVADEQPNPPFPGADGYWVERGEFPGRKSFGMYECEGGKCSGRWSSAHALPAFGQGCKRCERVALPRLMWFNNAPGTSPKERESPDNKKAAHDRARCQACAAGACTVDLERALSMFVI